MSDINLSAPQYSFLRATTNRNLLHCGQGFGKTHSEGHISAMMVMNCPDAIGLIGANTYLQLSDATLFRIFEVWKTHFGWTEYTAGTPDGVYVIDKKPPAHFQPHGHTFKSNNNKIYFKNGCVVMTASLDNYMALDGREISWAILDETKDTSEIAIKEVITSRLRGGGVCILKDFDENDFFPFVSYKHIRSGKMANPLWIFTSPSKEAWLSEMFKLDEYRDEITATIFDKEDYFHKSTEFQTVTIASSYWNKDNLPDDYIASKLRELSKDRAEMLVFGSPFGKIGVEYYAKFDRAVHVKKNNFEANGPIHLAWDFNVNPYMTNIICQVVMVGDRIKLRVLRELCLESPNNSIEAVCRRLIADYEHLFGPGLYYYGDATGKNSLPIEEARNYYKVVEKCLYDYIDNDSKRLLKKNINHRSAGKGTLGRRDFMNKLLSGEMGVDVEIDPSCKKTILDFEQCQEDANGGKDKKKVKINGVMAEKYGHTSDALDGLCCWLWY